MEIIKHSLHEHVLSLSEKKREDKVICDACNEDCDDGVMIYSCRECDFDLHESCISIREKDGEMAFIKHFSHEHVLSLSQTKREDKRERQRDTEMISKYFSHEHELLRSKKDSADTYPRCFVCGGNLHGGVMIYSCRKCNFKLHESCAKVPQELHNPLLHPHPLSLHPHEDSMYVPCNACSKYCEGFTFLCDKSECKYFNLDFKCAFIRPAAIEEGEEEAEAVVVGTHHFTHPQHPLLLLQNIPADRISCSVCREDTCSDPKTYGCLPCRFFLHASCLNLPEEIFHPFHPDHGPLTLKPIKDPRTLKRIMDDHVKCNACRIDIYRFAYFCEECDFNLDVKCSFIRPAVIEEGEEEAEAVVGTHHFTHHMHEHPLQLLQNIPAHCIRCQVCQIYCSNPKSYGCLPCGFFLHPSCFKLPEKIFHPLHQSHLLTLKYDPFYTYHSLKDDDDDNDDDKPHIYTFNYNLTCNACRKDIYRDKYCGCFAYFCEHFIAYVCEHCNNTKTSFCLHAGCASVIMPAITFEGHDHLLQFDDDIRKNNRGDEKLIKYCSACKSSCKSTCESYGFSCLDLHFNYNRGTDELIKYCSACKSTICKASYAFRCLDLGCDFNLHLTCGPLPSTIQHKSHIHPLILTNCPIEDEMDCEPDEFFCNACEEERDPFLPIYYCNECHFVAGISCVISEVLSLLKGEHGDVELRNPFGQFANLIIRENQEQRMIKPTSTLSDIFSSLSKAKKNELSFARMIRLFDKSAIGTKIISSVDWKCTEIIFRGDLAYTQFMKFVDIGIEIPIEFLDTKEDVQISDFKFCYKLLPKEEVVDVEDYKITRKLAPILKELLSKYGDVSAQSKSSPEAKLYFWHMLCECIYSMKNIKVVNITTNDLLNWWTSLQIISWVADFKIQFALDHLKRVALTHFYLSAEKQGSKVLEALKGKLKRLTCIKSCLIEKCSRDMLEGGKAGVGLQKAGVGLC